MVLHATKHATTLLVWAMTILLVTVGGYTYHLGYTYSSGLRPLLPASRARCTRQEGAAWGAQCPHLRNRPLHQTSAFPHRLLVRPCLLGAFPISNGEREYTDTDTGLPDIAIQRAEAALRKLSPSELEGVTARLNLDDDALQQDTAGVIVRAVPILAEKIRERDAARQALSSEVVTDEGVTDELSAPALTSPGARLESATPKKRSEGGGDDEVSGGRVRREWRKAPVGEAERERRVGPELESPLLGEREYFATCPRGLETVLRDELMSPAIGAKMVKTSGRGCHFRGNQTVGYRAILWLRSAHRVLELIGEGGVSPDPVIDNADSLYQTAAAVTWSRYMQQDQTLSVDAILGVVPDELTHSHFTALTVKNAVVDQFRDHGKRPSVDTDSPDLPLVVYLNRGRAQLYRSLSGVRSMHKRGYRDAMHAASLKENVAAGLLLASGWDPETQTLADPMCGSGTLVIEAALIAMRRAPGLVAMGAFRNRESRGMKWSEKGRWHPAISSWPDYDAGLWQGVVEEALQAARSSPPAAIMGNDLHHGALSLAWRDAKAAGVESFIMLSDEDASRWRPPISVDLAVTNPPWDYRMDDDAERSWRDLLEFLRRELAEKNAWVLSGNPFLSRVLRMKSEQNVYLATGGIELRWLQYRLNAYRGDTRDDRKRASLGRRGGGSRPKKVPRLRDRPAVDRW